MDVVRCRAEYCGILCRQRHSAEGQRRHGKDGLSSHATSGGRRMTWLLSSMPVGCLGHKSVRSVRHRCGGRSRPSPFMWGGMGIALWHRTECGTCPARRVHSLRTHPLSAAPRSCGGSRSRKRSAPGKPGPPRCALSSRFPSSCCLSASECALQGCLTPNHRQADRGVVQVDRQLGAGLRMQREEPVA